MDGAVLARALLAVGLPPVEQAELQAGRACHGELVVVLRLPDGLDHTTVPASARVGLDLACILLRRVGVGRRRVGRREVQLPDGAVVALAQDSRGLVDVSAVRLATATTPALVADLEGGRERRSALMVRRRLPDRLDAASAAMGLAAFRGSLELARLLTGPVEVA